MKGVAWRRVFFLALGAAVYTLMAWRAPPGFFDGFAPPSPKPYNWLSPPPYQRATNQRPVSVHQVVPPPGGPVAVVGAGTSDGQAQLLFEPDAFNNSDPVYVDIQPVAEFPPLNGLEPSTNVYLIKVSAPLVKDAHVRLRFSEASITGNLYRADYPQGVWRPVGAPDPGGHPYYVGTLKDLPAYFVGGSPTTSAQVTRNPGLQTLVIGVIAVVVVAGIPLIIVRRRALRP